LRATLPALGAGADPGAEAGDRRLQRSAGDGADARGGPRDGLLSPVRRHRERSRGRRPQLLPRRLPRRPHADTTAPRWTPSAPATGRASAERWKRSARRWSPEATSCEERGMRYMVALIAVLLMVISALGIVAPERLVAVVVGWPPESRLYVAVGTRLVL